MKTGQALSMFTKAEARKAGARVEIRIVANPDQNMSRFGASHGFVSLTWALVETDQP